MSELPKEIPTTPVLRSRRRRRLLRPNQKWPGNRRFTMREASAALRQGTVPMTPQMAETAGQLHQQGKTPLQIAKALGFREDQLGAMQDHDLYRMMLLRHFEEAGATMTKVATRVNELLDAEKVEVAKYQGTLGEEKSYTDHAMRDRGIGRVLEVMLPKGGGSRQPGGSRTILNFPRASRIQVGVVQQAEADAGQGPRRQE